MYVLNTLPTNLSPPLRELSVTKAILDSLEITPHYNIENVFLEIISLVDSLLQIISYYRIIACLSPWLLDIVAMSHVIYVEKLFS